MYENLTEKQTVEKAYENTEYTLKELVPDEAKTWDSEETERQAHKSAEIIVSEAHHSHMKIHGLILDRSITLWKNDMRRMPKDMINVESEREMVLSYDIWPNKMAKWEIREILESVHEREIPSEYWRKATQEVERGIVKKLKGEDLE